MLDETPETPRTLLITLTGKDRPGVTSLVFDTLAQFGVEVLDIDGSAGGFVPYLKVYGRAKQPCKTCATPITKIKLASRGTHFCRQCQR